MKLLNQCEVRVAGSLIEKKLSTPEYYPLSLNSLTNACNQKNSREPVVSYSDEEVQIALDSLREKKYARLVQDGGRVVKYKESFTEELKFDEKQIAVITVLMLRGPQTPGEIKNRSGRLYEFKSLEKTDETLNGLMNHNNEQFVIKLERQTGTKEHRYAHLLSGSPVNTDIAEPELKPGRIEKLEGEVEKLKQEIEELRSRFTEFKKQFE
ncbi:MAG: YceH family protein [Ignavibacteria bacterium]